MEDMIEHNANNEYANACDEDGSPTAPWPMPKPEEFEAFKAKKLKDKSNIFDKKTCEKNKLGQYLIERLGDKEWDGSEEQKEYINFEWIKKQHVKLDDFNEFRILGRGGFGLVKGVRHSKSGKMYANKIQNKSRMKAGKATQLAIEERKCLSTIESKFVVSLIYAYHDPDNVYLVLELLTGGDLQFHLKKQKKFDDDVSTYFLAATLQGIGALHDAGWVYRDLKPENILLSAEGHVKITDLGLATKLGDGIKGGAGTAGYTAPEILEDKDADGNRKLYDERCDFWSYGCLAYAFFDGQSPFYNLKGKFDPKEFGKDQKKAIEEATKHMEVEYTQNFTSKAKEFCKRLIERDPDKRLGACIDDDSEGWRDIEQHDFFKDFDFEKLKDGSMAPPFKPFDDEETVNLEKLEDIGEHEKKKPSEKWNENDEAKFKKWDFLSTPLFHEEVVESLQWAEENGDLRNKKKSAACAVM